MSNALDIQLRVQALIEREQAMGNFGEENEKESSENVELKRVIEEGEFGVQTIVELNVPGKFLVDFEYWEFREPKSIKVLIALSM
jgi:hypothetical protein